MATTDSPQSRVPLMLDLRQPASRVAAQTVALAVVFGVSLGAIGIDLGGRVGVFVAVLLPAVIPVGPQRAGPLVNDRLGRRL
jgi:hypothetical protein